jgi:drug/metabolite transporter (DMT)-like permease
MPQSELNPSPWLIRIFGTLKTQTIAIILTMMAMVMFTGMGICIRKASTDLHILQVVFFRNLLACLVMIPILSSSGFKKITMRNRPLYFLRALVGGVGMIAGFTSLTLIPLAEATAISFTAPIFITISASLILGEIIRIRRIFAIMVGFIGMLVIVQPGIQSITLGTALAFLAAISHAINALIVKKLTKQETSQAIVAWMVVMLVPITFIPAILVWEWPNLEAWYYLWALAIFGTFAHMCWTTAYSMVEITSLQPLEFIKLPLTALLAWIIFAEVPGIWTWVGGVIIFASTTYITHREARAVNSSKPNHGSHQGKLL